ncbi:MAG: hypothetical protein ABMB14_18090 [Myxococcota bacterium]
MARNPDLLRRMYGTDAPPPRREPITYGILPVFWIAGLGIAGVLALAVALGSLMLAATSGPSPLETWGVIEPEEWPLAIHDHSAGHDGTAGCVVTGARLIRWDDRATTASVDLPGATIALEPHALRVTNGAEVTCPFDAPEDPTAFAAQVQRWTAPDR